MKAMTLKEFKKEINSIPDEYNNCKVISYNKDNIQKGFVYRIMCNDKLDEILLVNSIKVD